MLRGEVLEEWQSLQTRLKTVLLTPKEKEICKWLKKTKTTDFCHSSVKPNELDELEKKLRAEFEEYSKLDLEDKGNELLEDWYCEWYFFNSTILDWIWQKKIVDDYRLMINSPVFLREKLEQLGGSD